MNHSSPASESIAEFLRGSHSGAPSDFDDFVRWMDAQLRRASQAIIEATLPPDVHQRYGLVKAETMRTIAEAAKTISHTLTTAKMDDHVLAGAVGEKVRAGVAELTSHNDYARAVRGIPG
jgi:predicted DNA-binding protein